MLSRVLIKLKRLQKKKNTRDLKKCEGDIVVCYYCKGVVTTRGVLLVFIKTGINICVCSQVSPPKLFLSMYNIPCQADIGTGDFPRQKLPALAAARAQHIRDPVLPLPGVPLLLLWW